MYAFQASGDFDSLSTGEGLSFNRCRSNEGRPVLAIHCTQYKVRYVATLSQYHLLVTGATALPVFQHGARVAAEHAVVEHDETNCTGKSGCIL